LTSGCTKNGPSHVSVLETRGRLRSPEGDGSSQAPSRLRICHLAYTFYETDNRVIRYAREMRSQGHDVDVIVLRRPGQPFVAYVDGVRVIRIQRRSINEQMAVAYLAKLLWFFTKSAALLATLHLRRRYDVVHVHNIPDFLIFAAVVPKLSGARLILDIHDILPELYLGKFERDDRSKTYKSLLMLERASCSFADHVIVANDLWRETLVRRSASRCTTILNYPDISVFKPLPPEQTRTSGPFVFLYPGSLNHHQGVDVAVRAFALAKSEIPNAEFHIYGEGPAKPSLFKLVADLGMEDRVKIMPRVPLTQMALIIAAADVGIVPKRADGFGNEAFSTKIFEFMASGVPVIVSNTRVDQHHFNETLVRFFVSGDDRDLANAMLDTFENKDKTRALTEAARRFAMCNSWQQRGGTYRELVESLVASPSPQQPVLQ
jgi:glycosyltransferase involved in cell wall biosynthesis